MFLFLIFPILTAGFVACHTHPIHRFRLHRYAGQYLYLKSAELGLGCFLIAMIIAVIGSSVVPDRIVIFDHDISLRLTSTLTGFAQQMFDDDEADARAIAWFFQLSVLTFVATQLLRFWAKLRLRRRFGVWDARVHVIGETLEDSPLDNLLYRLSLTKGSYVMLTMDDRKVYVGTVVGMGEPSATNGMDQDVAILPLMSGYRDKDTLEVHFGTHYGEVGADITLCIRQEKIVSATEFDFDAYNQLNPTAARKKSSASRAQPQRGFLEQLRESLQSYSRRR